MMTPKKTVILGATTNSSRYAFVAANMLEEYGMEYIPVGIKTGKVNGKEILDLRQKPEVPDVHTVTLYIGARNLPEWHDYILSLHPKRIIFNPGTEDQSLMNKAKEQGVETVFGCTLVMLRSDQF
ncbi:CoA-binding protein [Litoribacter ruber]|uniref:CoA-binding protein n=1 Tax=Litoribacter ruber TaxID=702568 RepID=A0AAP2G1R4_9BACT|nr:MULTISPECIES: CoA-binding protein [Litoribacter]MBS9525049.1 CoA-binding protein [Litoribacter alkaliphilus]MBT0811746.1 CoA-binding protein [Litoribacter ruber]